MTAYSASSLVQEALDEGAVEVFPKPLDLERVLRLIEEKAATTPVLVADGDTAFCALLGDSLAAQGFDVFLAHSAQVEEFRARLADKVSDLRTDPTGAARAAD